MPDIAKYIRSVPNFPKPGILFFDVTTLFANPDGMKLAGDALYEAAKGKGITKVVGIESRGFILGGLLADRLGCGFVPVRKKGKLPAATISESYVLEYGTDQIEIHADAIVPGDVVLLHDDLLATGGTAKAACNLIERLGGKIAQISFIIDLTFLPGRKKLEGYEVVALAEFDSEKM